MDKEQLLKLLTEHQIDILWDFQAVYGCECGEELDSIEKHTVHLAEVIDKELKEKK